MTSTAIESEIPREQDFVQPASAAATCTTVTDKTKTRMPFLDFMRAIASHCIVLHHLAFYGPLPDRAYAVCPAVFDWFCAHARLAVSAFFVFGGFFTSRGLCRGTALGAKSIAQTVAARYRRIAIPYLVTLFVAVVANEVARGLQMHEAISS